MKKEFLEVITDQVSTCYPEHKSGDLFGGRIEPILINSALVSAQSRQRYYWTNIPNIEQPEDKGIVLRDILVEDGQTDLVGMNGKKAFKENIDKGTALLARDWKGWNTYGMTGVQTTPKQVGVASDINGHDILKRVYSPDGKSPTLNTMGGGNREPKVVVGKDSIAVSKIREKSKTVRSGGRDSYDRHEWDSVDELHWRKLTPLECERLQTVPDNYTKHVSKTQRYRMLGNGWTIDVISHILSNMESQ